MYALGVPFTQIVDDRLPLVRDNTVFAGIGNDYSFWAAILEKAVAKRYGNYNHLIAGK